GPLDAVAAVGGDVDRVAWGEGTGGVLVGEAQPGGAGEEHDELGLVLVVPEPVGAGLAVRDDAFDAHPSAGGEAVDDLAGAGRGQIGEEVHRPAAASTPATARFQPARRLSRSAPGIAGMKRRSARHAAVISAGGGQ